jgi:hypothetical protein
LDELPPLHELSETEALNLLQTFLSAEGEVFGDWKIDEIALDYSEESLVAALRFVAAEIVEQKLSETDQRITFSRLGYYFGESLLRISPRLRWSVGAPEWALANHPVIVGFANEQEAPVILVCRNVVRAVAEGRSEPERIDIAIRTWFDDARAS